MKTNIKWYRVLAKSNDISKSITRLAGKTGAEDIEEEIEVYREFIIKAEHIYHQIFVENKSYSVIKVEDYK